MAVDLGRVAVIGAGKMGETLLSALFAGGVLEPAAVIATARHQQRLDALESRLGVATTLDNREAVAGASTILLCVKPFTAPSVLAELADVLEEQQLLISILAGVSTTEIERGLADRPIPVTRAMPNTPSRVGRGMTAVCGGRHADDDHVARTLAIFSQVGRSLALDEKYFDAVTGLSASGPAFLYIVIEAMAEGGVKLGLPRRVATELAAQTCLGAGHMVVETGDHPARLKDEVTTPAGCTIDGILKLEEGGLRVTLIKAIVEAGRRAGGLLDG